MKKIILLIILVTIILIFFYPPKYISLGDGFYTPNSIVEYSTCNGLFIKISGNRENRQASTKGLCLGKVEVKQKLIQR